MAEKQLGTPTSNSTDAATKTYVDTAISGAISTTAALAAGNLTATPIKTANYTAAASEIVSCNATAGAFTVTLPATPTDNTRIVVKKIDSSVNAVTVQCSGDDKFDSSTGSATLALSIPGETISVHYEPGVWYVVGRADPATNIGKSLIAATDAAAARTAIDAVSPGDLSSALNGYLPENSSNSYAATIGNGSATSIAVTHNLGTLDVVVSVHLVSTGEEVDCDVVKTTGNVVTLTFATAPALNSLRCTVIGTAFGIGTPPPVSSTGITDATATGRALVTAIDAAAARTAIGATSVGSAVFTADTADAARLSIGSASRVRGALRSPLLSDKILGGTIVHKPGHTWATMWGEWDWDNWIKPQIDRAVKLGLNTIRVVGEAVVGLNHPDAAFRAWSPNGNYAAVSNIMEYGVRRAPTGLYRITTAGVSGSTPPTGTGTGIVDGTCVWEYYGPLYDEPTQADYLARWRQIAQYCTDVGLGLLALPVSRLIKDSFGFDYLNPDIIAAVRATAATLAEYPCVIGLDIFSEGDRLAALPWRPNQLYFVTVETGAAEVVANGLQYRATTQGISASSGNGPSGSGTGITDGTVVWDYLRVPLLVSDILTYYAEIREEIGQALPLTTAMVPWPGGNGYQDFWDDFARSSFHAEDTENMWVKLYTDPNGSDFMSLHIYNNGVKPEYIDYLLWKVGKPVILGEFGSPATDSAEQIAKRFDTAFQIYQRQGIAGALVWALADQSSLEIGKYGVWDNTGWIPGSAPLSTTSGKRSVPTAILRNFSRSEKTPSYQPPELLPPRYSRPARGHIGASARPRSFYGNVPHWSAQANTTFAANDRGLGIKCTAGGATTGVLWSRTANPALEVKPSVLYQFSASVLADTTGRRCELSIEWFTAEKVSISTSTVIGGIDGTVVPLDLKLAAKSPSNAAYAEPKITWASTQATDEVHVLQSASFKEA